MRPSRAEAKCAGSWRHWILVATVKSGYKYLEARKPSVLGTLCWGMLLIAARAEHSTDMSSDASQKDLFGCECKVEDFW